MTESRLTVSFPGNALREAVGELPEGARSVQWDMQGPAPRAQLDIVVPPYMGAKKTLNHLDSVTTRLVQSQSIGYDGVLQLLPPGVVYANAASVHETSTAELALALTLASQRGIPDFVRAGDAGQWAPARHASLADRTVLLLGHGGVGKAIEARLLPFEATVVRVAGHARTDERGPVHAIKELPALLPGADIVILAVPLGPSTTHLVNEDFLAAMPDGALLVNVSRGAVADTDALVRHAATGRLRLALDVTEPEPLPTGHPLYGLPNVLITPHVGGASTAMLPRMARLLRRQVERMLAGEPPLNVVLRT